MEADSEPDLESLLQNVRRKLELNGYDVEAIAKTMAHLREECSAFTKQLSEIIHAHLMASEEMQKLMESFAERKQPARYYETLRGRWGQ